MRITSITFNFLFVKHKRGYCEKILIELSILKISCSCSCIHPLSDRIREVKLCLYLHSWRHKCHRQVACSYGKYLYYSYFFLFIKSLKESTNMFIILLRVFYANKIIRLIYN